MQNTSDENIEEVVLTPAQTQMLQQTLFQAANSMIDTMKQFNAEHVTQEFVSRDGYRIKLTVEKKDFVEPDEDEE